MALEIDGKIKKILETQTFPSGFYKREFVLTTDDRYPQDILFSCLKEKAEMLDSLMEGEEVTVSFDLKGREYNGRYYVDVNAWKIDSKGSVKAPAENGEEAPPNDYIPEDIAELSAEGDDIPF